MTNKQLDFFKALLLKKKEELLDSSRSAFRQMMAHDQKPSDEGDYAVEEVNQYLTCTIQTRDRKCLLEIEKIVPDCVILDYLMSDGLNGDEILIKIKEKHPEINVIILTKVCI